LSDYLERDEQVPRGIGIQRYYNDIRHRITREEIKKVWCDFGIDVVVMAVMIVVLGQGMKVEGFQWD
tara:strand:+ start:559 stop:759 length:201 start_codon:yes stop_codon:yes gene_type:complete